ncbi:heterokaryon incompatibility protein-domain-containing protein [Nemania serpens]|nr:heterokaryon incompatibility protein-domain-containing protein [Nemania serpens]
MEVCRISLDDAISLESRDSLTALRVNIFTSDAIQCCRLSCRSATKLAFLRPTKVLTGDTSSDISMQRARRMIEKCEQEHASCRLGREELLPKRLVDLSPTEHGEDHARLVEFDENAGMRGTYACLSHCWGQDPMPITTTQTTILENKKSMSLSCLPPTFRDAILIARKLKLRYIWIDSLCIMQDSRSDWESESAKMASIYKNAFITIAATASPDFQGGCFSKSDADLCFHVKQSGVLDTVIAARTQVTGKLPELYPLLTRGWVYQERMLSRRYLHCYRNELMLECREQRICECGNHPGRELYGEQLAAKSKYHNSGRNRLAGTWQKVVTNYSMLRLSKSSDKLPAIFGCAQDMGDPDRGRYLAGVWERTLGEDLLWTPRKYSTVSHPTKWRAPSWTWASIDTPDGVKFLAGGVGDAAPGATKSLEAFHKQIREARCDPKDADSSFDLDRGAAYLQIECKLIKAHIRRLCYSCRKAMTLDHWYRIDTDRRFDVEKYQDQNRPPCTFAADKLETRDSIFELLQDYKYTEATFEFSTSDDGHPDGCMIAPISLLKVLEIGGGKSKGTVTSFFLLLKAIDGKAETYNVDRAAALDEIPGRFGDGTGGEG